MADGGTILMDEVAGLPAEIQGKLLRVLSERAFRRLGEASETRVDVRFLFATSRDLETEAREGRFREDLLHRIRVVSLRVPPLRERREDLPDLVRLFLHEGPGPVPAVEEDALERLRSHPWSGNVRELRNVLTRLRLGNPECATREAVEAALGTEEPAASFPEHLLAEESLRELTDRLEREYILHHLRRHEGDTRAVSRVLGLSRQQFYRRARRLGIRLRSARGPPSNAHGSPEG